MKAEFLEALRSLHGEESGQDLIEYALVAALIAFGSVTVMDSLSMSINTAFSVIGSELSSVIS
jgi:pilus assembly protein Flp/PilA